MSKSLTPRTTLPIKHELKHAITIMAYHLGYRNREEYLMDLIKKDIYARSYELSDMRKREFNNLMKTLEELPAVFDREDMVKKKLKEKRARDRRRKFERNYITELRNINRLRIRQGRKQKKLDIDIREIEVKESDYTYEIPAKKLSAGTDGGDRERD